MNAKILDGKKTAEDIRGELKTEILELGKRNIIPGLAVVLVGRDPASKVYVAGKRKACEEVGINSVNYELGEDISQDELLKVVEKLNADKKVHGILVQLPLPQHIDEKRIIEAIDPKKDVDCFHPENIGRLFLGEARFLPCTPAGIVELMRRYSIDVSGKDCVVVGRSNIVGKPLALMLMAAGATVTICHSKTRKLKEKTLAAEILISAAGRSGLIAADMVQPGSVVVDVGMNRLADGKLVGDVDFPAASQKASAITPVPGGVGPMTIAMLLRNTVSACKM